MKRDQAKLAYRKVGQLILKHVLPGFGNSALGQELPRIVLHEGHNEESKLIIACSVIDGGIAMGLWHELWQAVDPEIINELLAMPELEPWYDVLGEWAVEALL